MKEVFNNRAFIVLVSVFLIILVIILSSSHAKTIVSSSNLNKVKPNTKSSSTPITNHNSQSISPYTGWLSGYLTNEKLSYKYPSSWQQSNSSQSAGTASEQITLTSPTDLEVIIITGDTSPTSLDNVLSSSPISTLGASYYLDFYTQHSLNSGLAQGACVVNAPDSSAQFPSSKNVSSATSTPVNQVCITYPSSDSGSAFENTVSAFEHDSSYKDALLIIESLSY